MVLIFKGTDLIEGVLSVWSFFLGAVYIAIFVASMLVFGDLLEGKFEKMAETEGWFFSGL